MPFLAAFLLVAAAELGDKTQLLTLGFASKYPLWQVISAVSCATAALMAIAVLFGGFIYQWVPQFYVTLAAGMFFILFGSLTLSKKEKDDEEGEGRGDGRSPFWLMFFAFFIAELGDKTQLATLALSAKYGYPLMVWLGATMGMVAVNIIAAIAGSYLKQHLSENMIRWAGGGLFIVFGIWTLFGLF